MGLWYKLPLVMGTMVMIVTHYLGYLGFGDLFGVGAVMSAFGLLVLSDLSSPEDVRSAVLEERARCTRELSEKEQRRRQYERGEITFGERLDPF